MKKNVVRTQSDPIEAWVLPQEDWAKAFKNITEQASAIAQTAMSTENLEELTAALVETHQKLIIQGLKSNSLIQSPEITDQFQETMKAYVEAWKWWRTIMTRPWSVGTWSGKPETTSAFWQQFQENAPTSILNLLWPSGTPAILRLWGMPVKTANMLVDTQQKWMTIARRFASQSIESFETKSPEMVTEINRAWAKSYQMALGALINIPHMGLNRESTEKWNQCLESYSKLCQSTVKFQLIATKMSMDGFVSLSNVFREIVKEEMSPETIQKLQKLIEVEVEKHFHNLFTSDKSVEAMRQTIAASLKFQEDFHAFQQIGRNGVSSPVRSSIPKTREKENVTTAAS